MKHIGPSAAGTICFDWSLSTSSSRTDRSQAMQGVGDQTQRQGQLYMFEEII